MVEIGIFEKLILNLQIRVKILAYVIINLPQKNKNITRENYNNTNEKVLNYKNNARFSFCGVLFSRCNLLLDTCFLSFLCFHLLRVVLKKINK